MCQSCYNYINDEYTNEYNNEYINEYMYDDRFDHDSLPDLESPSDHDSLPDLEPPSDHDSLPDLEPPSDYEIPPLITYDNSDYVDIDILINRYWYEESPEDDTY